MNKTMMNKALAVARVNFRNLKPAVLTTGITMAAMLGQDIVYMILSLFGIYPGAESSPVGLGNYLYLLVILSAVFIPAMNFRKMMNLGAKRDNFFLGCAVNHVILAAAVSLGNVLLYLLYEPLLRGIYGEGTLNLLYWFGWMERGPVVAFLQQFAFLTLAAAVIHTLTAAQGKWYGWVADGLIVVVLSVFIPIAPLRRVLVGFFHLMIFHPSAWVQVAFCLALAAAVYLLNRPILARKAI
jgi:hypothetical protein